MSKETAIKPDLLVVVQELARLHLNFHVYMYGDEARVRVTPPLDNAQMQAMIDLGAELGDHHLEVEATVSK